MSHLWTDLRFAGRQFRRSPVFAVTAILTLALGVAANGVVFSVFNGVLLRPLPYASPDGLVEISAYIPGPGRLPLSTAEFFDIHDAANPFAAMSPQAAVSANLTGVDEPEHIESRGVTGDFFPMMGVRPVAGRVFTKADELPGINQMGVISYRLWQRRFGGRSDAIGKTMLLDDDNYTIIGVMPAAFSHPGESDGAPVEFWYPTGFKAPPFGPPSRQRFGGMALARLAPGVGIAQAQSRLTAIARGVEERNPDTYPPGTGLDFRVRPLRDALVGDVGTPLRVLLAAVACVLLIACINVASLQLARSVARQQEFAVRLAHGAARHRLVRQLLTEGIALSVVGATIGLVLTMAGVAALRTLLAPLVPRAAAISVDATVVAVTVVATVFAGIVTGLSSALVARRGELVDVLRQGARGLSGGRRAQRARSVLVVTELALALALVTSAGLLVRSLGRLGAVEPGFDPSGLLTMRLSITFPNDPKRGRYVAPPARAAFYREVLRRVAEVPGVTELAGVSDLPFSQQAAARETSAEGRIVNGPADMLRAEWRSASANYFAVMRIPVVAGRGFTDQDVIDSRRVVVVNRTLARQLWSGDDPIGKRVKVGPESSPSPWLTVVGVVGDVRAQALDLEARGQVYTAMLQAPPAVLSLAIRTAGRPRAFAEAVRGAVRSVESDQPVYGVRTMSEMMNTVNGQRRLAMVGLSCFGTLSLLLALVGAYGLISYSVARRTREFGVRLALGATPAHLVRLVAVEGLGLAGAGIAIGLIGSLVFSRLLTRLLFGVSPMDPATLLALPPIVLGLVLAACYVPGRRAAGVQPSRALASE